MVKLFYYSIETHLIHVRLTIKCYIKALNAKWGKLFAIHDFLNVRSPHPRNYDTAFIEYW